LKAIVTKNIHFEFHGQKILEDISFEVDDQSFTTIFGPNGAGKTTLLSILSGNLTQTAGEVLLFDKIPSKSRGDIGYVPQIFSHMQEFPITVLKAVITGRYGKLGMMRKPTINDEEYAKTIINEVGLLGYEDVQLSDLSYGLLQRTLLARALAGEPKILFLDEATSAVDTSTRESLFQLLAKLKQRMCIVFVTHDMSVISHHVDSVLCLNKTLVAHGKPELVLTQRVLKSMYGEDVSLFSHCDTDKHDKQHTIPLDHAHVKKH
jgi:zinc transport system ATP-binding protein